MNSFLRTRRIGDDDGYALVSVIGLGTALLLSVGAVSAYGIQAMSSAGSTQGFHASVQAAQAGVDQFIAKLNDGDGVPPALNEDWKAVPGSRDGSGETGELCDPSAPGGLPRNCPEFRYDATYDSGDETYELTSYGRSRGDVRAVKVTLNRRSFTDYLYYSAVEAADPNDRFVYPQILGLGGAPTNCELPAWGSPGAPVRPASGCAVPAWRTGDSTDGSRVHTSDVFSAVGGPEFGSRVTAAIPGCATDIAACVLGGTADMFKQGDPGYADDLTMPGPEGLTKIAAAAQVGGCTYYGPTRIRFEGNKMRVWSPQTPADPPGTPDDQRCGGGVPPGLLNINVNCDLLAGLLTLNVGQVIDCLDGAIGLSGLLSDLDALDLGTVLANVVAPGNLVTIRPDMAIHVRENLTTDAIPDPGLTHCLVGSALGMYSTADTNLTAGLLNLTKSPQDVCRAGKLFVDGTLDGSVSIGVAGDILIMSNLRHLGSDDRLGMVATGPIEVYNPLQCTLAVSTCLSVAASLPAALNGLRSAGTGNLTTLLGQIPGARQSVTVEAALISLQGRIGVQLPVLSPNVNIDVLKNQLNQLIALDIDPPTLTVKGSVAQKHRGLLAADLAYVKAILQSGTRTLNLLVADVDFGYQWDLDYDERLRAEPPRHLPSSAASWRQTSFAEVPAAEA